MFDAEVKLDVLYLNVLESIKLHLSFEELVYLQSPKPIHTDNTIEASIIHQKIKHQHSCSINLHSLKHQ